ncbi:hypothetical protein GCM10008967_23650 [Bacillus carboniphilus]|uniref:Uncharacterized protein n=1 Tax=Bacillus carboniphilus TaxID=86663 RepID=A0ABP3G2P6_9BACI
MSVLYTTVPHEQIFPTDSNVYGKQMMMEHNGIPVLVEQEEEGFSYRIVKVMSSDPSHFLRDDCCPGTRISFTPQQGQL